MPLLSLNGQPVVEAVLVYPRVGRWVGSVAVDADAAEGLLGACRLMVGDVEWTCTARRGGEYAGQVWLQLVGGAGGLLKYIGPDAWTNTTLRVPLSAALAAAGERLSAAADAQVLGAGLPYWVRLRGECLGEVQELSLQAGPGVGWRFGPDGSVWFGRETWPLAQIGDFDLVDSDPSKGTARLGVEVPRLQPGTTLLGRRVGTVTHKVTPDEVRTLVVFDDGADATGERNPTSETDRLIQLIDRQVSGYRFAEVRPGRVVQQNADGSVDLVLDDPAAPRGLKNVPLRSPWPGVGLKVAVGSRAQVAFENGSPTGPVTAWWEPGQGSTLELVLAAGLVKLGSAAPADAAALASRVLAELQSIKTQHNLHFHTAPPGGGPTTPPTVPMTDPGGVASSLLLLSS